MKDEALTTPANLTASETAVLYLLKRIRGDADLRYHMLHTEAFARLCRAEAERTGRHEDEVEAFYAQPEPHCENDQPRLVVAEAELERRRKDAEVVAGLLALDEVGANARDPEYDANGNWIHPCDRKG